MNRRDRLPLWALGIVLVLLPWGLACGETPPAGGGLAPSIPPDAPPFSPDTWRPDLCPPVAEPAAAPPGSDANFAGACSFHHAGAVPCEIAGGDFGITVSRQLPSGLPLFLYVQVNDYHGPGAYAGTVSVVMTVQGRQALFRWHNSQESGTVLAGAAGITLPGLALSPTAGTPAAGTERVSGTFTCAHA